MKRSALFAAQLFLATSVLAASWSGNQTISGTQVYSGETIICSGNITINGTLELTNGSILKMDPAADGLVSITVAAGGILTLSSASKITANNPAKRYNLIYDSGSSGSIESSTIEYTYGDGSIVTGFVVKSSELTIDHSTIESSNSYGIIFSGGNASSNTSLANSTVKNNSLGGILVTGETFVYIHDNTIADNSAANIIVDNSSPTISGNTISGSDVGIKIEHNANPGLGDLGNANSQDNGGNIFIGQTGKAIDNNTANTIKMENNNWLSASPAEIAGLIDGPADYSNFIDTTQLFTSEAAGVQVLIPASASLRSTVLTIAVNTSLESTAPTGKVFASDIIDIQSAVTSFLQPVSVTIPIKKHYLGYGPYYWDGSAWQSGGLTVTSQTADKLTFTTTHLSSFALLAINASLGSPIAAPNPFNPLTESTKLIYRLNTAAQTSVYIFDFLGNLIWQKAYSTTDTEGGHVDVNQVTWDGKTQFGEVAENGVYSFKIISGGKYIGSGKMIVLR